ncbi:MAG: Holliday junction branch migration protein RuvA [Betaproteobacteria bacterium]|jgi:Holliday junction DNA helicase RuvA|nr:Holliday junction branch migration protein RuvA [Betaproteobacteria bacterium]
MIGRISGTLIAKQPPRVIIDVQGVGYEIDVPMSTLYELPDLGRPATLLTHLIVREDAQLLYGFATEAERNAFRELIRVSGVGPRIALAVLSGLSVEQLSQAVSLQETGLLTRVPGIGKKTAERLILELKGRMAQAIGTAAASPVTSSTDILNALLALGYSEREALPAIKTLGQNVSVAEGIRQALKQLAK